MRPYPLDPEPGDPDSHQNRHDRRTGAREGVSARLARAAADGVFMLLDLRYRRPDLTHLMGAFLLLLLGLSLISTSALTDRYLHRGVESGSERPYVVQPSGRELSTNVDLRIFTPDDIRGVAATTADAGFGYVRQKVSWAEVEATQGQYDWSRYDPIVDALSQEGIDVILVIVDAPAWAVAGDAVASDVRPPADPETLQSFCQELTSHFGAKVPFLQVWDRPNLASRWGGKPATGVTFAPYLEAAFYGARSGNPEVQIITPELARRPDVSEGLGDLAFLDSLYRAQSSNVFDIVGISLPGGQFSPDDRRVNVDRVNFSRAILFRELMLRHGDGATPIWATTYGWAADNGITRDEQAEYVVRGLERAWSEWPWMGLMIQWQFATQAGDPQSIYAIAPEGSSTPLYRRLTDPELQRRSDLANTGFAPMDADAVAYQGNWDDQHLEGRTFRTTNQVGSSATVTFRGTGLIAFLRSGPQSGDFELVLDGEVVSGGAGESGDLWSFYTPYRTDDLPRRLMDGLDDTEHTAKITLKKPGELTLGGLVVEREPPFVWPVILMTVSSMILLFLGLRSLIYLVAIRSGHLRRRAEAVDPAFSSMPGWQPGRRLS